jgi:hypothetical protein
VMDDACLFNQPVAAKRDARAVAADCHDVDVASVRRGEAVTAGSSRGSKEGVGLGIGLAR